MSRKFYRADIGTTDDWVLLSKKNAGVVYSVARKYFSFSLDLTPSPKAVTTTVYCLFWGPYKTPTLVNVTDQKTRTPTWAQWQPQIAHKGILVGKTCNLFNV